VGIAQSTDYPSNPKCLHAPIPQYRGRAICSQSRRRRVKTREESRRRLGVCTRRRARRMGVWVSVRRGAWANLLAGRGVATALRRQAAARGQRTPMATVRKTKARRKKTANATVLCLNLSQARTDSSPAIVTQVAILIAYCCECEDIFCLASIHSLFTARSQPFRPHTWGSHALPARRGSALAQRTKFRPHSPWGHGVYSQCIHGCRSRSVPPHMGQPCSARQARERIQRTKFRRSPLVMGSAEWTREPK
jgi:hypothetical protein